MVYAQKSYIALLVKAIEQFQDENLMSEREISHKAWLSPTMISKIKKWTTIPKLSTLRKLKEIGVVIPKPDRAVQAQFEAAENWQQLDISSLPSGE